MASTKDMTLLPGTIVGCAKASGLGGEGQYVAMVTPLHPPLEGPWRGRVRKQSHRSCRDAAVDHDGLAGREGRGVGAEIGHGAGDFVGLADAAQRRAGGGALQV